MPRAIWSGSISFGLVNIPVKLFSAVKDQGVHFHQLHAEDGARLRQKMVCPVDGDEVRDDEIVKGFEIGPDRYVTVEQDELDALAPKTTRTIEIEDFVGLDEIDPVYFVRPYYLLPEEGSAKAYGLLHDSMRGSKMIGVGRFVMHNKEYLAALRPLDGVLCLETMRFSDEVIAPESLEPPARPAEPAGRELEMAHQLIDMLAGSFEPAKYHDEYREAVMDLVGRKAEGLEVVTPPSYEEPGKVVDLVAALEKSLAKARKQKAGGKEESGAGTGSRKGKAERDAGRAGRAG